MASVSSLPPIDQETSTSTGDERTAPGEERLTTGSQHEFPDSWGNGGRSLVFLECRAVEIGLCDVSVLSMAGDRQSNVLLQTEFNEGSVAVSPDGRWLAYDS